MTVAVPVRVDGEVWGALSVDALNAAFPEGTVERMMRFADLASIAIAVSAPFAMAGQSYIDGFINHWSNAFNNQSSIVMVALGVGAVGVFIITRGKWKK